MHRLNRSKIAWILKGSMAATLWILLLSTHVMGQVTSGTISGSVKDPSGAVVVNATVVATDANKGVTRTVTTGTTGDFVFANLPPGNYTIAVDSKGFKKLEKSGIILNVADHVDAGELLLEMGTATESVTVTAEAGLIQLQSNSGERSDLITNKQLQDVAMNGRNVLDYIKLVPGVISSFDGHASGTGGLDAMNINGTRANEHEFTIDGASNVDTGNNGGTHVTINPDAIEEVKILTSNYQAEFGKAAGGQIAIVTKSGTNEWHGNARLFHRHEGLNANNWFSNQNTPVTPRPLYRYNYIGYNVGGPILKNRLFVFWNQEFYRQLIPASGLLTFYTPTDLEKTGDFSQSVDQNGNPVAVAGPGIAPGSNKIDRNLLTPTQQSVFDQMKILLALLPEPNVSGYGSNGKNYNYAVNPSYDDPRREDILRVDYQVNQNNRLFGRWIHNHDAATAGILPWPGLGYGACTGDYNLKGTCTQDHPGWNFSLNLVSTIRPDLLNEFSFGPSVTKSKASPNGNFLSRAANNITLPLLYPVTQSTAIPDLQWWDDKNSQWNWTYLGATPWYQSNTTINVNDNLSWIRKSHAFKFGVFYQRSRKDQIAWGNVNGEFQFSNSSTAPSSCPTANPCSLGSAFASMLEGMFSGNPGFKQSSGRPTGFFRYNQLEFYAQDTWKLTPRFTLDYGMRFAWIPPQYDARNQIALFDPAAYNPANAVTVNPDGTINTALGGNPLNGVQFASNRNIPSGGWRDNGIMPEPRLGFAYDMLGNHKTVLRGGFGMMHDRVQGNLIFNPVFNNPLLVQSPTFTQGQISDLPGLGSQAAAGLAALPLGDGSVIGASRDGKVPTVYSFSLGVQRQLFKGTTLDVAYVGTMGRHLVTQRDINAIPYGYAFTRAAQDPANFTSYCQNPLPSDPCTGGIPAVEPGLPPVYSAAGFNFSGAYAYGREAYSNAPLVSYKGFGQIPYLQWDGTSNYNSLQASLQRRFTRGLTFGVVYTWSKALTTASADQDTQDPFYPRLLDYRAADWDRQHVFAANYVYDLPNPTKHFGGPKWLSYVTDNYQLSGVTQFMSGTPIDLNNGWSFESGAVDGSNMWGAIPYYYSLDASKNLIVPPVGPRLQRPSRDILRSGGLQNWDISLFKNIPIRERYSIQLRLEAFNAFNHPNFNDKYTGIDVNGPWQWAYPGQASTGPASWSPNSFSISKHTNFGQYSDTYTGMGGPRVVQLGVRFSF